MTAISRSGVRILFVTRKFPPQRGGMERVAYDLYQHLSARASVELIEYARSNRWLPFTFTLLFFRSVITVLTKKIDVVYLQDGLLSPIGVILKLFGKPVAVTIHGRDIIFDSSVYQTIIPRCAKRLDRIICISDATRHECLVRGIPEKKISIVPNGISDDFCMADGSSTAKEELSNELKTNLTDKKILLSVGRLVKHKGFHWFVEEVMPDLVTRNGRGLLYLIAGSGEDRADIHQSIVKNNLQESVFLLGDVDDDLLKRLYMLSDILVMPNIPVKGSMEGFGIVSLEASSCGLPVVASNLQGISDAVVDGENGFLVQTRDVNGFIDIINRLLGDERERRKFGERSRKFTLENYDWGRIGELYLKELVDVATS